MVAVRKAVLETGSVAKGNAAPLLAAWILEKIDLICYCNKLLATVKHLKKDLGAAFNQSPVEKMLQMSFVMLMISSLV